MTKKPIVNELAFKHNVRLLLIQPAPPEDGHEGPHPYPVPAHLLRATSIDSLYCAGAPVEIWDEAGCARVAPLILEKVRWAEARGYDAVIVNCMLDPGVASAKRMVRIPVVGAGEASMQVARLLGNRIARIYPAGIRVPDLLKDPQATYDGLMIAGRAELDMGADTLVLACALLNRFASSLQQEFGVPVLPNEEVALKLAEMLAIFGLHACAPQPLRARLVWFRRDLSRRASRMVSLLKN